MNSYCCVPQCSSWVKRNPELSFHTFPKAGKSKVAIETKLGIKEPVDRRLAWIRKLKIGKKVSDYMRVCSLHFEESDFLQKKRVKRRTLKCYAIPSKRLPRTSTDWKKGPSISHKSVVNSSRSKNKGKTFCKNENVEDLVEKEAAAEALITLLHSQSNSEEYVDPILEMLRCK